MLSSPAYRGNKAAIGSIFCLVLVCFLSACGSTTIPSPSGTASTPTPTHEIAPTDTPTPGPLSIDAAKNRFIAMGTAIQSKDYAALYSTTSMEYQNSHTEQQMITDIQQMIYASNSGGTDIANFAIGQITVGSRSSDNAAIANGAMSFTFANGNISGINPSLLEQDGGWKIANLFYHQQ